MAQEYYNSKYAGTEIDESIVNTNTNIINIGDPINLTTTDKTNLVGAINEVTTKTENNIITIDNLVEEISDNTIKISDNTNSIELIDTKVNTNQTSIGTLVSLNTIDKSSLVNAINEVSSGVVGDFVVEHDSYNLDDTSDYGGGYEKWNSGFLKMWGSRHIGLVSYTQFEQIGTTGIYYRQSAMMDVHFLDIDESFITNVVVNAEVNSMACWCGGGYYTNVDHNPSIMVTIFKVGNEAFAYNGSYIATGRWK